MATKRKAITETSGVVLVGLDLGDKSWTLGLLCSSDLGDKPRKRHIDADPVAFQAAIAAFKQLKGLPSDAPVKVIFEVGREGFWPYHWLRSLGHEAVPVDASSIEMPRRSRKAKTDGLDACDLVLLLARLEFDQVKPRLKIVRVPSPEQEDRRRASREREDLVRRRGTAAVQVQTLLKTQGIVCREMRRLDVDALRDWAGKPLGELLRAELKRKLEVYALLDQQIKDLERARRERLTLDRSAAAHQVQTITQLVGVGPVSAHTLIDEFGWREFRNGKQVGGAAGFNNVPFSSGNMSRDRGISKAGNPRVRRTMVELAWLWIRHQRESALTRWYYVKCAHEKKKRRRMIVALARKLLVALWRMWSTGEVPDGARLRMA